MVKNLLITVVPLLLFVAVATQRKNVLFIAVDDLRPELGCYDDGGAPSPIHPSMHTPNIDRLAGRSLLLKRAHVQQAICSPSRASVLTGRRPDTTHVYDLNTYWRLAGGNFTTIPQHFKENGYLSVGMGKIYHPAQASGGNDPPSWSEPYYTAPNNGYYSSKTSSWREVMPAEEQQRPLPDQQVADHAKQVLRRLAPAATSGQQPFFIAVGFYKPHLPFVYPARFGQRYPLGSVRLPKNPYAPRNMPHLAWNYNGEIRSYRDINATGLTGRINHTLPDGIVKDLRRAYYSSVTYVDSLIGDVLAELETLGLDDSTIVALWGDHGWQLGEHALWCKHTNFELATHTPMMVRVPGMTDNGIVTEELAEFVDIFPTLVEAAGLPRVPVCPESSIDVKVCTEGMSLMPLMSGGTPTWKKRVFSQYPRRRRGQRVMGYSMRTDRFRYTEWVAFSGPPNFEPDWSVKYNEELYDHQTDPGENVNLKFRPDYDVVRQQLSRQLRQGWRAAMPSP